VEPKARDRKAVDSDAELNVDRSKFSVALLGDPDDSVAYWFTRPVEERLQAIELLRRTFYGYTKADERLQRVLEVVKLERC
jgi:hypothetical protein